MICREYSRSLRWWGALQPEEQAVYLADLKLRLAARS